MLKKITLLFFFLSTTLFVVAQKLPPRSNTLVTDSTGTLTADQQAQLENKLVAFADSTSTQIAVVILRSVSGYDINQYGAALIRSWGIGVKGKNNGILILVALNDRKVAIQTGYGAEGAVPDIVTHQIIENDIKPNFKDNKYYEGLDAATSSLMKQMRGEYKADAKAQRGGDSGGGGSIGIVIFIVIVILIIIFRNIGGGGGHIIGRRGSASPFWWFLGGAAIGNSMNNGGGFFGGGGSDSGGSGGDSGGFGGFGGGDSGGGGSSGSW